MLTALHRHVRHHRSQAAVLLVVLALAALGAAAHSAVMSDGISGQMAGQATSICLLVGASLALTGPAVLAARRVLPGPTWAAVVLPVPVAPPAPPLQTVAVRAGPPSLLQVFRF